MSFFQEEFIEQVRDANDIVELIGEQVSLERRGNNLVGLCPFHNEKTPSFSVSPEKQMYYCFGCHASGNVYNFVMETNRLSFPEAVRFLAARANIPLPQTSDLSPAAKARQKERKLLYRANQWALRYFCRQLGRGPGAEKARDYLAGRGLNDDLLESIQIGYAPPGWSNLFLAAQRNQVPLEALEKLGLVVAGQKQGYYDRFRNRIMIPITDTQGRVVGFGGRVLDDALPKYLNSPESLLFNKGKLLYGLRRASGAISRAGHAVLVEGYMDCLAAWQYGIENVVATLGTALTEAQARLLKRYTPQVILAYDADASGLRAALRGAEILTEAGLKVKLAILPENKDPDDCLRQEGPSYFRQEILGKAVPLVELRLTMLRDAYDLQSADGKAQFVSAAAGHLASLDNEVAKAVYAGQLAAELGVPEEAVLAEIHKVAESGRKPGRDKLRYSRDTTSSLPTLGHTIVDPVLHGYRLAEDKLLGLILQDVHHSYDLLRAWRGLDVYVHEEDRRLVNWLCSQIEPGYDIDIDKLRQQAGDKGLQQRLTEVALIDNLTHEDMRTVANDCLRKLEQLGVSRNIEVLQTQLAKAETDAARSEMLKELQTLIEKMKGLRH